MTDLRHTTHCCELCRRVTELYYCKSLDSYLCQECIDNFGSEKEDYDVYKVSILSIPDNAADAIDVFGIWFMLGFIVLAIYCEWKGVG